MVSNNAQPTKLSARRREGKPVMGRQEKSGVRLLGKFWQEKAPATAQVTKKYRAGRAPEGSKKLPLSRDLSGKRCYVKLSISSKCAILALCIFLLTQASFSPQ